MERLVAWGLAGVVFLAPLPFASNRPWSWSLLSLIVGLLVVIWAMAALRHPEIVRIPWRRHAAITVPYLLFVLWGAVQAAPWTPKSWHHPFWSEYAARLGEPLKGAISLNPADTMTEVMRFLAYGGAFWLALHLGRERHRAIRLCLAIAIAGFVYSLYGTAVELSGSETILWYKKWAYPGVLTSTFVNRNNFATYAGVTMIVALAMLVRDLRNVSGVRLSVGTLLEAVDRAGIRAYAMAMAAATCFVALLLTESRGGFAAAVVGVATLLLILMLRRRRTGAAWATALGSSIVAAFILVQVAGAGLAQRLERTQPGDHNAPDLRTEIYQLAGDAVRETPWLGSGLGTFDEAFHRLRPPTMWWMTPDFDQAHNTYIELLLETGPLGLGLMLLAVGAALLRCVGAALRRERSYTYPASAAAAGVLVAVHALVDFSIEIPAMALTFATLLGVGVAQSWQSGSWPGDQT